MENFSCVGVQEVCNYISKCDVFDAKAFKKEYGFDLDYEDSTDAEKTFTFYKKYGEGSYRYKVIIKFRLDLAGELDKTEFIRNNQGDEIAFDFDGYVRHKHIKIYNMPVTHMHNGTKETHTVVLCENTINTGDRLVTSAGYTSVDDSWNPLNYTETQPTVSTYKRDLDTNEFVLHRIHDMVSSKTLIYEYGVEIKTKNTYCGAYDEITTIYNSHDGVKPSSKIWRNINNTGKSFDAILIYGDTPDDVFEYDTETNKDIIPYRQIIGAPDKKVAVNIYKQKDNEPILIAWKYMSDIAGTPQTILSDITNYIYDSSNELAQEEIESVVSDMLTDSGYGELNIGLKLLVNANMANKKYYKGE